MGLYDSFSIPGTPADGAQVKCFEEEMNHYKVGDNVPLVGNYGIVLREGGVAIIDEGVFVRWEKELPTDRRLVDKWGGAWVSSRENVGLGLPGETYFFEED